MGKEIVQREISFELSKDEIFGKAVLAGELRGKQHELEEQLKDIKADFKRKIDTIVSELDCLLDCLKTGKERRTVDCEKVKNFTDDTIDYYYNNQVVDSRAMTIDDRQLSTLQQFDVR